MRDLHGLRIAFVAGTLGQGGAERQLYYILKVLMDLGAQPMVFSLTRGEFWEKPMADLGVPIHWIGQSASRLARLRSLVKALRSFRPSLVQSQHFYANPYVALAARAAGIVGLGAMRNDGESEVRSNGRLLGPLCLKLPRFVVANSRSALAFAESRGVERRRLRLLPNVVDVERFSPGPPRIAGPIRVLGIGRLERQKRYDRFLRVIAGARANGLDMTARIVGDGGLKQSLRADAEQLSLGADVMSWSGPLSDPLPAYRESDLLLLTSDWEGTPNVVLEAMACGIPVLASAVGDVPNIVDQDVSGYAIGVDAEDEFIGRLASFGDRRRIDRMGLAARESMCRGRSFCMLEELLSELYGSLPGNKNGH